MATKAKAPRSERALAILPIDVVIDADGQGATICGYHCTDSNCECNDYRYGQNRCIHIIRFGLEKELGGK